MKKIMFLTGTRADFGKLKSLLHRLQNHSDFEIHIFITGMHMLTKYGYTCIEVEAAGVGELYKYINQNADDTMDAVLAKTINGLSDYVKEIRPDMIVVHGDRVEALAGAIVGSLNNILVAHIEGGEVSGTIDELIRHAVSKMSHIHFVANEEAKRRLLQMGEVSSVIKIIGSPDIDIMKSKDLPPIEEVCSKYEISFNRFGILLFHPVTTDFEHLEDYSKTLIDAVLESKDNYVVIYPNNDHGSDKILKQYERLENQPQIKMFPSMRFEYFLSLMKHCSFMIGNSSAGVREAPFYGKPTINVGNRQHNRATAPSIINTKYCKTEILAAIERIKNLHVEPVSMFGEGDSDERFVECLISKDLWNTPVQKYFVDLPGN